MIRPLRQRHRRIIITLGILLPVAFVAGVAARKSVPGMASLPPGLAAPSQKFTAIQWERTDLFTKTPIQVRLLRENAGAGRFAVQFSAAKDFVKPDLLVYWVSGNPNITDKLPGDAQLLGVFNPSMPLPLPPNSGPGNGVLVLYSLADQEVVEVSKPFAPQKP